MSIPNLPSTVVLTTSAGAGAQAATVGRSSSIAVPVLRDFVSIMDFAAKGDAKQVTDATIASGSNLLHSTAAAFTTAVDVGKQVNVVGAGTAGAVLTAYIGSVSGGVASLVTTHGGSTAANASTTISSGGTVNYGTLDTTALQNAINAVSSNGGGVLLLPAGFQFLVGQIVPKGNVTLWCYGATVYMDQTTTNGIFYWNVVDLPSGNLGRWQIRGGVWTGTGKEADNQQIFLSQVGATCNDVRFYDMHVTDWFSGFAYIRNATRARAIDNTLLRCGGSAAKYNLINFASTEVTATELIATGNVIDCQGGDPINVVCGALSGGGAVRYVVADNHVSTSSGPGVAVEWVNATAGSYTDFVIANNTIVQTNTDPGQFAMMAESFHQTDPTILRRLVIKGNTVSSATSGLFVNASDANIEGNVIQAAQLTIFCGKGSGSVSTVTATTSNASPTLTSVSVLTGAPLDGSPVTGTGITGGTFVKSGTGTGTWTLSQNATASATVTVTIFAQDKNVTIHNNTLRCAINPGDNVFQCYGLRNSTISENRVIVDAGTTTSTQSGMSFNKCGWMDIHHNHVEYAPRYGIAFDGNDFDIHHNRVYNCSENGAYIGILISSISGTLANATENTIIDDRAVHKMLNALDVTFQTNNQVLAARNHMRGYTASHSINGQCAPGSIDNDDAENPGGARVIQINATNASYPIPAGATSVRITVVGGGGGGGGGGSAGSGAPTATQVGGAGGAAGGFASMVIPVGATTTINFAIGAKGTGGAGAVVGDGTAGKVGTNGTSGGATTAALGATTIYAGGGLRGTGAAANSAAANSGQAWEAPWGIADGHARAGGGGQASSTNGENGGNPFGYVGGGGQGGSPASATNGGLGGSGGLRSNATSIVGGGTAPTPAGTNGTSATANTGAGGGGGGGGSYNSGTTPGIGGTGGDGATGYALLEVLA